MWLVSLGVVWLVQDVPGATRRDTLNRLGPLHAGSPPFEGLLPLPSKLWVIPLSGSPGSAKWSLTRVPTVGVSQVCIQRLGAMGSHYRRTIA